MKLLPLIGLAGLADDENPRAQHYYRLLEWPMMAAGLSFTALWYLSSIDESFSINGIYVIALWLLFVLEAGLLSCLATKPLRYLKNNWINLAIIIAGVPVIFGAENHVGGLRLLRLLVLLDLALHMGSSVVKLLSRNSLGPIFLGSSIVIVMSGVIIAGIDPTIHSAADGIWWAWVTVTTVGYGDIVPSTPLGRILGAILIFIGLGLLSLLTASMATMLITQEEEQALLQQKQEEKDRLQSMDGRLMRIESKLDQLLSRQAATKVPREK